jgi:hypothetical protein
VGFAVDKVALGQVFSEHFGFTCESTFHLPTFTESKGKKEEPNQQ